MPKHAVYMSRHGYRNTQKLTYAVYSYGLHMAYIGMAYIGIACIVTACIVMAYIVMAYMTRVDVSAPKTSPSCLDTAKEIQTYIHTCSPKSFHIVHLDVRMQHMVPGAIY